MKLVNFSVPRAELRIETLKFAQDLMKKNPRLALYKECIRAVRGMDVQQAADYLNAKSDALRFRDPRRAARKRPSNSWTTRASNPGWGITNANRGRAPSGRVGGIRHPSACGFSRQIPVRQWFALKPPAAGRSFGFSGGTSVRAGM